MSVGKNIRKFRKLNKLTQEELANKLGVSDKTISSWEIIFKILFSLKNQ